MTTVTDLSIPNSRMVRKKTIKIFLLVIVTAAVTALLLSPWLSRERFQSRTPTIDTVIDIDTFTKIDTVKIPHTILVPSQTDTVYQERIQKDTTLQVTRKTYDIDNDAVGDSDGSSDGNAAVTMAIKGKSPIQNSYG